MSDWPRQRARQREKALSVWGLDEATAEFSDRGASNVEPFTTLRYARVVLDVWYRGALPAVVRSRQMRRAYNTSGLEKQLAEGDFSAAATMLSSLGHGEVTLQYARDFATGLVSAALAVSKTGIFGGRELPQLGEGPFLSSLDAALYWQGLKRAATSAGGLNAAVSDSELWRAFTSGAKEGLLDAADAIGEAAGAGARIAGEAAGKAAGGALRGLGVAGIAAAAVVGGAYYLAK